MGKTLSNADSRPARTLVCGLCVRLALASLALASLALASAVNAQTTEPLDCDVLVALDDSGSMRHHDPGFMTGRVVRSFLESLSDTSLIGLIVFSDRARLVVPLGPAGNTSTRAGIQTSLAEVGYRGRYTDIAAALERAVYEFRRRGRESSRRVIVLLTDGIVDTGDAGRDAEKRRWLREELALEARQAGIRIFGIAFTEQADFELIQSLSLRTDGAYYRAFKSEEIAPVFEEIRQSLREAESQALASTTPEPVKAETPPTETGPAVPAQAATGTSDAEPFPALWIVVPSAVIILVVVAAMFYLRRSVASQAQAVVPIPEAQLFDLDEVSAQASYLIQRPLTRVGRVPTSDVWINKDTISALHATIEYRGNTFYLRDRKSTNGTFLNNVRVRREEELKGGDVVAFHEFKFRFMLPTDGEVGQTIVARRSGEAGSI